MSKETLSTSKEKEVPKHRNALTDKYEEAKNIGQEKEPLNPENIENQKEQLPEPSGWRLLVLPFTPKEKTKGGILIAQESLEKLRIATNCGYVLRVGPLAYYDKEKFPTGPWGKQGDWVILILRSVQTRPIVLFYTTVPLEIYLDRDRPTDPSSIHSRNLRQFSLCLKILEHKGFHPSFFLWV